MKLNSVLKSLLASAALATALVSAPVSAATINGLYNTGDSSNAGQQDTNYALTLPGGGAATYGYEAPSGDWPVGPWLANSTTSQWLMPFAPVAGGADNHPVGNYKWVLTFDLTGFDANTASFAGRWSTDNAGSIKLNGNTLNANSTSFTSWTSFAANSGFLSGLNTLEFALTNYSGARNPAGLRVEFTDSNVSAVPLPAAAWLFGSALLGFMGFAKRRKV